MRVLLCVGCDDYENANQLNGAEQDATRIYEVLIKENIGEYDRDRSRLLLSPRVEEVRQAVQTLLFSNGKIDTFTFFFAGHGGLRAGSFYMWLRDTRAEAQSLSAFSLSDLFRSLNESAPAQSNIIIDACESGGLIADLGVLLKTELIGDAGTPGVTLLATSAKNQTSGETPQGGFGTNAILDCIEGRDFVNDTSPALDLVEIGRRVSDRLRDSGQNPVVWGLNLYGPRRFCRNPRFGGDPAAPLRNVLQAWGAASDVQIAKHYEQLWAAYTSTSGHFDPRSFSKVIESVLVFLKTTPEALAAFAERFAAAVLERAQLSTDPFRPALACGTVCVSLLPYADNEPIAHAADRLLDATLESVFAAGSRLLDDLREERYALLSKRGGGLSALFYLPLRITKAMGWTAAAVSLSGQGEGRREQAQELFRRLLRQVLEHYDGSLITVSDAQAPYLALILSCAASLGMASEAEELAGHLYFSFIECKGNVARSDIPAERVLDYLNAARAKDFSSVLDLVERPNETLAVLLRAAHILGLDEVFDDDLYEVDGLSFCAYITSDYSQFGNELMREGKNFVWTVGHDVFRTKDFLATWPNPTPRPASLLATHLVIVASLLYPDRVPWFCLDDAPVKPVVPAAANDE